MDRQEIVRQIEALERAEDGLEVAYANAKALRRSLPPGNRDIVFRLRDVTDVLRTKVIEQRLEAKAARKAVAEADKVERRAAASEAAALRRAKAATEREARIAAQEAAKRKKRGLLARLGLR